MLVGFFQPKTHSAQWTFIATGALAATLTQIKSSLNSVQSLLIYSGVEENHVWDARTLLAPHKSRQETGIPETPDQL